MIEFKDANHRPVKAFILLAKLRQQSNDFIGGCTISHFLMDCGYFGFNKRCISLISISSS